ncbi:hypothetical protein [Horticoccus sp. 23ND18S-11]|uniref:hypothetical protein n=1 Tax=Horticoccus sp. 23ND18S-11 TaxID=3391832 RepID=UPI0039C992E0
MIRRRQTQVFSLAFLDCICCGFGAIILIFVLSVDSKEKEKREALVDVNRALVEKLAALTKMRASKEDLERSSARVATLVTDARLRNDSIHALIDELEKGLQREKRGQEALLVDIDDLKKEIAARQKKPDYDLVLPDVKPAPVGLPVGNNYIAFVIDTSGSMRDPNNGGLWPIAIRTIESVLDVYPNVDGIQLLDGDGRFVLGRRGQGTGGWLADTPDTRASIKRILRRYDQDTVSNPVPGIYNAMRFLYDKDNPKMRMGIFVFGDEFNSSDAADLVVRRLDELNPADENGVRKVTINAVGFPTTIRYQFSMGNTGLRFANLMRTVTYLHGGAFIALQDL